MARSSSGAPTRQHPAQFPPVPDLTIAQAAEAKGVATKTVRRWISSGVLPAYRVGPRLIRVRRDDLDSLGRRIPAAGRSA